MKKRYYNRKDDPKTVIDRLWDKDLCRCYFKSDAIKIKKALNAQAPYGGNCNGVGKSIAK